MIMTKERNLMEWAEWCMGTGWHQRSESRAVREARNKIHR